MADICLYAGVRIDSGRDFSGWYAGVYFGRASFAIYKLHQYDDMVLGICSSVSWFVAVFCFVYLFNNIGGIICALKWQI